MLIGRIVILGFMFLFFCKVMTANAVVRFNEHPLTPRVSIVRAEFGLFNSTESEEQAFVPTRTVPFTEKQSYGWVILLETKKPKIRWREEFTLPAAPATWGDVETQGSQSISEDRRVSITEREVETDQGLIFNSWAVAPGDPKGRYFIRVIVENSVEQVFEFDVK